MIRLVASDIDGTLLQKGARNISPEIFQEIDRLDRDEYETLVWKRYDRLLREAFDPYWQRHNRWTGKPGNRWIYNDIFKKFWHPPYEKFPSGGWINSDYTGWDGRFPPNIGDDPEKEN